MQLVAYTILKTSHDLSQKRRVMFFPCLYIVEFAACSDYDISVHGIPTMVQNKESISISKSKRNKWEEDLSM